MAEEKKKESKPLVTQNEIIFVLIGLFILALIINNLTDYIYWSGWGDFPNVWNYFYHSYLYPFWEKWKIFAAIITGASIVWLGYSTWALKKVEEEEEKIYGHVETNMFLEEEVKEEKSPDNERWQKIVDQSYTNNPSDWAVAIMEADKMLEDVLRKNNYPGDTIGEMLKSAGGADQFLTLDAAWEAHKIRNKVAHGGNDFQLTDRETRRAITLFEQVFREFGVI